MSSSITENAKVVLETQVHSDTEIGAALRGGDRPIDPKNIADNIRKPINLVTGAPITHERTLSYDGGYVSPEDRKRFKIPDECDTKWVVDPKIEEQNGVYPTTVQSLVEQGIAARVMYRGKQVGHGHEVLMMRNREYSRLRDEHEKARRAQLRDHLREERDGSLAAHDVTSGAPGMTGAERRELHRRREIEASQAAQSPTRGLSLREGIAKMGGMGYLRSESERIINAMIPGAKFSEGPKNKKDTGRKSFDMGRRR